MDRICYEQMAEKEDKHFWHKARRLLLEKIIRKTAGAGLNILDVGCGTGGNYAFLKKMGTVDSFEPDIQAVSFFQEKNPDATVFQGALPDKIPPEIQAKKYDLIVALDVMEHLEDDGQALKTLAELLTKNGRILLTVPACSFLFSPFDETLHHFRRYDKKDLKNLIRTSGLTISYLNFLNFFLFPAVVFERLKQKITKKYQFKDDYKITDSVLNSVLFWIFVFERHFLFKTRFPIGSSLVVVAQKQEKK